MGPSAGRMPNLKRSAKPKQATNIVLVQPEIQGIAHNFAPLRLIRYLRQETGGQASRIDEAAPPAFGETALVAARPDAMAITGVRATSTEGL